MEIELFVSHSFKPCRDAERIYGEVAGEQGVELAIVDVNSQDGGARAQRLGIKMVPAPAINGRRLAIGVQTPEEVRDLLAAARR